jgi:hypothetical protein
MSIIDTNGANNLSNPDGQLLIRQPRFWPIVDLRGSFGHATAFQHLHI